MQNLFLAISLIVAIIALYVHRNTAKKQFTLDIIREYLFSSELDESIKTIRGFDLEEHEAEEYIAKGSSNRENYLRLINYYDLIGIGIKNNVYDEKLTKDTFEVDKIYFF